VECAMYEMEGRITTIVPGKTPCLECLVPEAPATWKRQFPVLGAVSGTVACLAATEAVKSIAQFGEPLHNRWLQFDTRDMTFRTFAIERRIDCPVCG
jgi:molybdopterin-synthase adenylyltransferase